MKITEFLREGVYGLTDHPLRTLLTTLGIIIGVAAVIAMVSIGAGARREALEELKRFGTRSMRIVSRPLEGEPLKEALKKMARGLSLDDLALLRAACPFLERAVGEKVTDLRVYCLGAKPTATVVGVGEGFLAASNFEVARGRWFDTDDESRAAPVCVLGHAVATELFGTANPCGQIVQIGRTRVRIVGVMREQGLGKGKLAIKSRDHDRDLYLPLATTRERIYRIPPATEDKDIYHDLSALWLTVHDSTDLLAARDTVMRILKRRHRGVNDLEALVPLEMLRQSQKTQELFNQVMAFIAGLSLLVGGIGIMNIMLATVNERTREIGVRRALGATRRDIVGQFLTEAALISLLGGLIGIGVGIALSHGIAWVTGWTTVIPLEAVVVAFVVSLSTGLIFGIFPAVKAARLDPVIALRYE